MPSLFSKVQSRRTENRCPPASHLLHAVALAANSQATHAKPRFPPPSLPLRIRQLLLGILEKSAFLQSIQIISQIQMNRDVGHALRSPWGLPKPLGDCALTLTTHPLGACLNSLYHQVPPVDSFSPEKDRILLYLAASS